MLAAFFVAPTAVAAAELVMVESSYCEWCEMWDAEVGVIYSKTPEADIAPLRRVDIDDLRGGDVVGLERVIYTPTFILLDDGQEIGRIIGYPGESHFWALLGELIVMIKSPAAACGQRIAQAPGNQARGNQAQSEELKC